MRVTVQDFAINAREINSEVALRHFLSRRFDDAGILRSARGSNRFILWFGDDEKPSLRVYVRDGVSAAYFTSASGVMYASVGDSRRTDWQEFRDDASPDVAETILLAGGSLIPWPQGLESALEFACNRHRSDVISWEGL
ncbi:MULTISPECIES: hypothetical protein [unclassified Actinobaculum]|uniref:hypothetical protein n=1 Tax=unclassified Actinobaculum TaxID=2609299 RepID=UPI000D527445|nr:MULTISPECIES: hypothetical protein [unclassified Actinobaculum]AWE41881.1 hypothetical protein DDD63_02925 [Actinobaculum sp. 313]RTE50203.1 hypothetical protein EKN07_03015 [Actinobaculum sp. 352]